MYKRVESKRKERLSWESQNNSRLKLKNKKSQYAFLDTFFNPQSTITETIIHLAKVHTKLFGLVMLFVFPYTLGLILFFSLFYIYTGMGLHHFIISQEQYNEFEPWVIGFYLLMSISMVGFAIYSLYHLFKNKKVKYFKVY